MLVLLSARQLCAAEPFATLGNVEPADEEMQTPFRSLRQQHTANQAFQRRVGQILITGNTVTKNRVIRQYLDLAPGDVADTTKLRTSVQNLVSTRLFEVDLADPINPTPMVQFDPAGDPYSEFQDIIVSIEETQTASFMVGGQVNSDRGLGGNVVYHERNFDLFGFPLTAADLPYAFRGAGQEFRVEAIPGTHMHRYLVSFREPRLLGLQTGVGASGYYYRQRFSPFDETRGGGRFRLNQYFTPEFGGEFSVRVENVQIQNPSAPALPDIAEVLGGNFLVGLKVGVDHDTRDSHLRPTQGHYAELAFEQVLGDFTYPIIAATARQHWTLTERPDGTGRQVLTAGARLGYAGSRTPIYDRFYAGGLQSIRGFQFRGVSPVIDDVEIGGDFVMLANLEYMLPLTADDRWSAVAFVDSGTVERQVEIRDYRVALGAGLRVQIPLLGHAPIAVDVAFPVNKLSSDDRQIFSFFVGFYQ